jgi:hypothetical protein
VNTAPPPHYTAFRLALVAVVVGLLVLAVWWVAYPPVLASLVDFLGLG